MRKELERKIQKKIAEIAESERKITAARAFIEGLQEAIKLAPPDAASPAATLRVGSEMDKVRNILLAEKKPLHIDEVVKRLGADFNPVKRAGLAGSLSTYAKQHRIFTKTAPNTFGLIEFNASESLTVLEALGN